LEQNLPLLLLLLLPLQLLLLMPPPPLLLLLPVKTLTCSLSEQCLAGLQHLQDVTECGPVSWVMGQAGLAQHGQWAR
jgi:hypothetical protein